VSGIDEQNQVFNCPKCEGEEWVEYWVLRHKREDALGKSILLGFLNNLKAPRQRKLVKKPPLLQITLRHKYIDLRGLLCLIDMILCPNCRRSVVLDSSTWRQILNKIREGWEGRAFI